MPTEVVTTETTVEATEAERARAAADAAAAAAQNASAAAAVEVSQVTQNAADRIAAFEQEASGWRGLREQLETQRLAELSEREGLNNRLGTLEQGLASILDRLQPPPAPPLTSPPSDPPPAAGQGTPAPPAAATGAEPEPQAPPARKRAQRWI